ncbi:hypothetical protein GCM10029978_003100 [Actinoallomurus acanthiterrae]
MTELDIGGFDAARVRVALDPYISVLALTTDAFGRRRGAPERWRHRIRSTISPANAAAIRPIVAPGRSVVPESVTPINPVAEAPVTDLIERLHDISADELRSDVESVFGGRPPADWGSVAKRPRHWLHSHAEATREAWSAVRPLWQQARPLLHREVERVGTAAVRGRLDVVLGGLHPRSRYEDGVLRISDPEPTRFELGDRPLVLVPMLSGDGALICNFDRTDAVWIGYPMPGVDRLLRGEPESVREDALELLLGPVRAQVLGVLAQPRTMGELAALTELAPSAVTYHCERLAAIGLVQRERSGRQVRVSRTARGESLMDMFR